MDKSEFIYTLELYNKITIFKNNNYEIGRIKLFNDKIFVSIFDDESIKVNSKNYSYTGHLEYGDKALHAIKTIRHNIFYNNITLLTIWTLFVITIALFFLHSIKGL